MGEFSTVKQTLDFVSGLHKGAVFNYGGGGGERTDKFWGRVAVYWRPIWGGLKFSEPVFRGGGCNFLGAFGRWARTEGFCVTEILSTAWNTMAVQVILTELHTQS